MQISASKYIFASVLWFGANCFSSPVKAELPDGIVTSLLLGGLEKKTNNVINNAKDAGDALIWNAAKQAASLIEAWKKANSDLLDKTFNNLDRSSRELFISIDNSMDRISKERELAVNDAQSLTLEWAQMMKSIPLINKDAELWYYSPKVVLPVGNDDVILRLVGPKLANSSPTISSPDGNKLRTQKGTETELQTTISRDLLKFDQFNSKFVTYHLKFIQSKGIVRDTDVSRDITVWLPPVIMGHYKIIPKIKNSKFEYMEFATDIGGRGKDKPYPIGVGIRPDLAAQNWKIDLEKVFNPRPGWYADLGGDHADCAGLFEGRASEDNLTFNIQMGHRIVGGSRRDGWKNCRVFVPLRRKVDTVVDATPLEGDLNWSDDVRRDIPADIVDRMISKTIEVKLFNGRTHVISDRNRSPLGLLTVDDQSSSVTFRPSPPTNF